MNEVYKLLFIMMLSMMIAILVTCFGIVCITETIKFVS
jgi:hypothetical protein